jgi:hypothetical protein
LVVVNAIVRPPFRSGLPTTPTRFTAFWYEPLLRCLASRRAGRYHEKTERVGRRDGGVTKTVG